MRSEEEERGRRRRRKKNSNKKPQRSVPFSTMAIVLFLAVDTVSDVQSIYIYIHIIQVLYLQYPRGEGRK